MTGQAGTLLGGRYRLGEPIGRGGMGAVWRALDTVLDREVAIKTMALQAHENPDAGERFRREARVLARLSHPRLGGVYDYGEEDGRAYMAMEFLTGETLRCCVARLGRIPATDAAEIAAQVAEGLHAAHQAGVIHRDVKPGNIILTGQGVKLVDFGIALGAGDDRLTATGTLVGSATYLAPERCAGRPATYASDVYSLAVVLYQMLAGLPPFTSNDPVQLVSSHAHDPVPPLPGDVPALLGQCCMRAMEKDPARRPASALDFAVMLREGTTRGRHALVSQTGAQAGSVLAGSARYEGGNSLGGTAVPLSAPVPGGTPLPATEAAPGAPVPNGPALMVNRSGVFGQPAARDGARTGRAGVAGAADPFDGAGAAGHALDRALDRSGALGGAADGSGGGLFEGSRMFGGSGAFGEPAPAYGNRSWPATQVLSLNESWEEGQPRRRRRWWLPAIAVVVAVVAGTAIAVTAVGAARGHHAAKPGPPAAHARPAGPGTAPAPIPASSLPASSWSLTIGAQNQSQPPPPVLAPPGTTVRLAETLLNSTGQAVTSATLGLSAPQGWTVTPETPPTVGSVPAGGRASVTWRISIPAAAQPGGFSLTASATCAAAASCAAAPVTGSALVPYAAFGQAFNNAGIAPQADGGAANLDGTGQSYQAEALAAAGYLPGGQVMHDGISFAWPNATPGAPDNIVAQGQTFLLSATGAHLAFLGAATFGSAGGNGTIFYQNGTQQAYHLVMDDWWANQATPGQDEIAVTTAAPNGPPGQPPLTGPPVALYFASIPLQQGSTVAAVTLPAGSAPAANVPSLHLFAVAVG